jgi:hypothetical protein
LAALVLFTAALITTGPFTTALTAAEPAPAGPPVPAGTVFHFFWMVYMAGRIEFRDAAQQLWPNYFYEGKYGDVRGRMVFDPQQPVMNFTLACTRLCQPNDGLDLKILGEVMNLEKVPVVRFSVTRLGAWQAPPEKKYGPYELAPLEGELDVDGRKVSVKGAARIRYNLPKGGDLRGLASNALLGSSINVCVDFAIRGRDLKLQKVADKDIQVTVHSRAFSEATVLSNTRKKSLAEAGVKE